MHHDLWPASIILILVGLIALLARFDTFQRKLGFIALLAGVALGIVAYFGPKEKTTPTSYPTKGVATNNR